MSNPTFAAYKIGTNFCLEFNLTSPTPATNVNLDFHVLNSEGNREQGVATVFPTPVITTVEKDGVTYYSVPNGTISSDMITIEFMMNYPFLRSGAARLEDPQALTPESSERLLFQSYFILRNASIPMSMGRMIFDSLLGTWTTTVNNSLGSETCSSTIRECGGCFCVRCAYACEGVCVRVLV